MLVKFTAALMFVALIVAALPVAAAPESCGAPLPTGDGWSVERNPELAGFNAAVLCEAVRTFVESPRNLHALVVERHDRLVAEAYRAGADRSTYSLWTSQTQFDRDVLHDLRSVTKSVVALLWGIAENERAVPPLTTPVLDLLPALADLRTGGRELITLADMLCMRSGLAWDETGGYGRWGNDEKDLLWRGDRARYVFDRRLATLPGANFNYNGGLTAVLGLLIEERAGMSLQTFARQRLFEPLGIRDWEWVSDLRGRTRAYTGLRLRPRDLARIGRLMLDGGRWKGQQVVPEAWVRTLLTPCAPRDEFGHHWWSGETWVGADKVRWKAALGNGGQRLFIVPALDLVVVTTAGEYNHSTIGRVQEFLLLQVLAGTRELAGEREDSPLPPAVREAAPVETRAT